MDRTLLVTGASGHLGRRVVELLVEEGAGRVIAGSRRPVDIEGAEARRVDFDDAAGLEEAFSGVDRVLIVSTDAVGVPGRRLAQHLRAVRAAARADVGHVVYTSLVSPEPGSPVTIAPDHHGTEEAIRELDGGHTILRNNLYADGLLLALPAAAASGTLATARAGGRIAFVTREDCARAAAAALVDGFEGRRTLDITGPDALSGADLAGIAAELAGRPVAHASVPPADLQAGLLAAGLPAGLAELLVSFDLAAARGDLATVSTAVRDLTGRAPAPVAAFLQGAWPRA